jgi:hypothetical protein
MHFAHSLGLRLMLSEFSPMQGVSEALLSLGGLCVAMEDGMICMSPPEPGGQEGTAGLYHSG